MKAIGRFAFALLVLLPAPVSARAAELTGILSQLDTTPPSFRLVVGERAHLLDATVPLPASGSRITARGRFDGATFRVEEPPHVLEPAKAISLGPRTVLVLVMTFPGRQSDPAPALRPIVFTGPASSAAFMREASFGQTDLVGLRDPILGDVAGPFEVTGSGGCEYWGWGLSARNQAEAQGWDTDAYDHVIHYFPNTQACSFGGLAQINGRFTWINGVNGIGTIEHELGHNFGLFHANSYHCTDASGQTVSLGTSCRSIEYGDPNDEMGSWDVHFSALYKGKLGWLAPHNMATETTSGTYTIAPAGARSQSVQSLRVPRTAGKRNVQEYLYIDYRQPAPVFEVFDPRATTPRGASIRLFPDYDAFSANSNLIDATPGTGGVFLDAQLLPDRSLYDPQSGVLITTLSATPLALTIRVTFDHADSPPAASIADPHPLATGVPHAHEGARATDPDADLARYTWQLIACPSECPPLSFTGGVLAGSEAVVPGPEFTPDRPGDYTLELEVRDGAGGAATQAITERAV